MEERQEAESQGLDLHAGIAVLRRRIRLVLICVAAVGGSALGFSLLQQTQYSATASLLFQEPGFDASLFGGTPPSNQDPTREAATNTALASLQGVADGTAEALGKASPATTSPPR